MVTVARAGVRRDGHVSVTPDGQSGVTVSGSDQTSHTSPGHSGSAGATNSTPASYGSSSPAAPPPPATWAQMMTNDPNADLSNRARCLLDSCGSDWGGDGWNAQYAQPTPVCTDRRRGAR